MPDQVRHDGVRLSNCQVNNITGSELTEYQGTHKTLQHCISTSTIRHPICVYSENSKKTNKIQLSNQEDSPAVLSSYMENKLNPVPSSCRESPHLRT